MNIIGYAVWFSFSKARIPWKQANEIAASCGLDVYFYSPSWAEVLDRICDEYKEKKLNNKVVLIRKICENAIKIIIENRDPKLEYAEYADIRIKNGSLTVERLAKENEEIEKIIEDIKKRFEEEKECISEEALRRAFIRILRKNGNIKLKQSGSIYFIHKECLNEINLFRRFLDELKKTGHCEKSEIWVTMIGEDLREVVAMKIKEQINEEIQKLVESFGKNPENMRNYAKIINRMNRIYKMARNYKEVIDLEEIERFVEDTKKTMQMQTKKQEF